MYFKFLLSVTIFLTLVFIILWIRTFNYAKLKHIWLVCKKRVANQFKIKKRIEAAKAKGEKPFYYGNKKTIVIYAIDKKTANLEYQRMLLKANNKIFKKKPCRSIKKEKA
jgi:hypothetical protein